MGDKIKLLSSSPEVMGELRRYLGGTPDNPDSRMVEVPTWIHEALCTAAEAGMEAAREFLDVVAAGKPNGNPVGGMVEVEP